MTDLTHDQFEAAVLDIMSRKQHWSEPYLSAQHVCTGQHHVLIQQEYAGCVRDLSLWVATVFAQCPIPNVRQKLAECLYDLETGALSGGLPFAERYLQHVKALGLDMAGFRRVRMLPQTQALHAYLTAACSEQGWDVGAAISLLFVKPSHTDTAPNDRSEDTGWRAVSEFVFPQRHETIIAAMEETLQHWLAYRDATCKASGLTPETRIESPPTQDVQKESVPEETTRENTKTPQPRHDPVVVAPTSSEPASQVVPDTPAPSIKDRRKALGWNRAELARRCAIDKAAVQLIELGQWAEEDAIGRVGEVLRRAESGEIHVQLPPVQPKDDDVQFGHTPLSKDTYEN